MTECKTPWTNFKVKLFTAQKRLEPTSRSNCTRRKIALNQLQAQFVHCTRPFLHRSKPLELTSIPFCTRAKPSCKRSMPFCSRCKAPWTNFKALLYTCKTVMQAFKPLLHTAQNRPANVQGPIVPCVKPPYKCSEPQKSADPKLGVESKKSR